MGDLNLMAATTDDSDALIERARRGDPEAGAAILAGHREWLLRLIARRLDRRLCSRIDPSDVIQEALADASRRLPAYLLDPPLPLLPWLRQFALERLARLHRHHIRSGKRSVDRERRPFDPASGGSGRASGVDPVAGGISPSEEMIRDEDRDRVRRALARLLEGDREVLRLRHVEALPMAGVAEALGVAVGAAKVRHLRALRRLQSILETLK